MARGGVGVDYSHDLSEPRPDARISNPGGATSSDVSLGRREAKRWAKQKPVTTPRHPVIYIYSQMMIAMSNHLRNA